MNRKALTLSIVIPVYNEQRYLKACLDSIKRQAVKPDEVIVVDNNSTDRTVEIARSYPFVRLLREARQHQSFAQKTGFDAAKGDIIGRIDGDTILPPDWVECIKSFFEQEPSTVALTGAAMPYDVSLKWFGKIIQRFYNTLGSIAAGKRMLWGTNMALRRTAWRQISTKVLQRADIWEDYDASFLLAELGAVRFLAGIEVGTSFRAVHKPFGKQLEYQFRAVRTFNLRASPLQTALMALIWGSMVIIYPLTVLDQYVLRRH